MTSQEVIAKRCIQWMNDVIDIRNELYEPNEEMEQVDLDAIEDARYIIECIEKHTPKEAKFRVSGNGWNDWLVFICPACGKEFKDTLVCPKCHQVITLTKESENND